MKYIIFCFCFLISQAFYAQTLLFNNQTLSVEGGLSSRSLSCALEDNYGFIWVGSGFGLNRYDGYQTKVYQTKDQLQSNVIYQLYNDPDSFIWIQHNNKVLDIIHPVSQKVWTFEAFFETQINFTSTDISYIFNNEHNHIYVKLTNGDYYRYFGGKNWQKIAFGSKNLETLLHYIYQDASFGTWVYEGKHCYHFDNNAQLLNSYSIPPNTYVLGIDPNHKLIWYQYNEGTFQFLELVNNNLELLQKAVDLNSIKNIYTRLNYIPKNIKLFSSQLNLLCIKNHEQNYLFKTASLPPKLRKEKAIELPTSLKKPNLNIAHFNNKNRLLIVTEVLQIISLTQNYFQHFPADLPPNNLHSTRSILIDTANTLYVQNYDLLNFLWKKTENTDSIETLKPIFHHNYGAGLSILLDQDQVTIWIGTENAKVIKYHPPSETVEYYQSCEGELPAFKFWAFWALHQDKNGQLWVGSRDGIHLLDTLQKCLVPYNQYNDYSKLAQSSIMHFHANERGLWVASNSGLYLIDSTKGVIEHYHSKASNEQYYIPSDYIVHIYESPTQQFWLATKGDGLIKWSPQNKKYKQFTELDGLSNNRIHAVYADQNNHLWMSSDNGLMSMNLENNLIKTFLPKDGLPHQEFNLKSHFQDNKGNLYFGGLRGIIKFNPAITNTAKQEEAPLQITDCTKWTEQAQKPTNITPEVLNTNTIELYPNDILLTLRFALIDFKDPQNHQYTYKIDGYTKDWIISNDNFIQINSLPYGQYKLEIKGRSTFSTWQNNSIQLTLIVYAPFYTTWWFWILISSLLAGLIFIYYKYQVNKLEQQKKLLEDTVKERTIKIHKDKQTIEKQAEELQKLDNLKSKFFANISHELRTPLTLIKAPLQQLLEQVVVNNKIDNHQLSNIKTAYANSQKLNQLIDEILLLSKLDAKKLSLESENILLFDFLKQTFTNFESTANLYQIDFQFQTTITAAISISIDWKKLERILYNLLSNAFKFTPQKGQIILEALCPSPNSLIIRVKDNGLGIHPDDIEYVFDRYYQSKQLKNTEQGGTGIGLALSKEFAHLLGGTLTVSSVIDKGSTFELKLPIKLTNDPSTLTTSYSIATLNYLPKISTSSPQNHKAKILIVEDNEGLRTFIANLLTKFYQVHTVIDGQAALAFLEENKVEVDLILSDIMMPRLDGFQLSKKIKANPKWATIPLLILSARADQQDKLTALRIGVDDYIIKPFDTSELLVRIQNLLHNYQQRQLALKESQVSDTTDSTNLDDNNWLVEVEKMALQTIRALDGNFNLPDLAQALNLSERQFRRNIKNLVGLTPNQYLRELRLKVAKDYLEQKRFNSVQKVAQSVGFTTANHFSKLYEERYGKKPVKYFD